MTSPRFTPASSAALPARHGADDRAGRCFSPRLSAMSGVTACTVTPSCARVTLPLVRSCSMTFFAMFDRNREADADVAVVARQNLRVDADQLAFGVDERAAGVAVVDRRVGLQEVLVAAVADGRSTAPWR